MNQPHFILEIVHAASGQLRRIQITKRSLKYLLGSLVLLIAFSAIGAFAMVRTAFGASRERQLEAEVQQLRAKYRQLESVSNRNSAAVSSLSGLAHEVSAEYGIAKPGSEAALDADDSRTADPKETMEHFNFLKAASYATLYHRYAFGWQQHQAPAGWPVQGALRSSFGGRTDPFSGGGEFHTGVDLQASTGTPVHVTADGVVLKASYNSTYGNLVIIDHGNGYQTYYAHLSQFSVVPGQEVRLNQVVGLSGGTGRVTSPHLHYEVRINGVPVNPYRFLTSKPEIKIASTHQTTLGF